MDKWPQFAPLLIIVGFSLWWLFVMNKIGSYSGWRDLHQRYAARAEPKGQRRLFQGMRMGRCQYSGTLLFIFSPEGFYLRGLGLFRPGHPPLLIPWTDMREIAPKKVLWIQFACFEVGTEPLRTIQVSEKVKARMQPFLQRTRA